MTKTIIEKTAIEMAAAFYEHCAMRNDINMTNPRTGRPYKNQRHYVKLNFEKFIPKAIEQLLEMLNNNYPDLMKQEIYEAIIERVEFEPMINGAPVGQYLKH